MLDKQVCYEPVEPTVGQGISSALAFIYTPHHVTLLWSLKH